MMEEQSPEDKDKFDELEALANEGKLTENKLQEELANYTKAYKEEFDAANEKASMPSEIAQNTREFFRKNGSIAAAQIVHLALHSANDSVRASCSKYVVDKVLEDVEADSHPINELLKSLAKK